MKKFEQRLGLGAVIAISIGSMLGSGIFVLPGVAFSITGPSLAFAYLLAAICILPAAVSKSELASAMPSSGGTYIYLERTFGPLAGTVGGLGLYLSLLLKSAFALVGFAAYLEILAPFPLQLTALVSLALIVLVNILGVGKVSSIMTVVVASSILSLIGLVSMSSMKMNWDMMTPMVTHGTSGLVAATATVFVAFAGVTKLAAIAEEIKSPEKNLPRGILFSLVLVTSIYFAVTFVMAGIIPMDQLEGNLKPIYTLAEAVGGKYIAWGAAAISILTMVSMANAGILAASRFPFAMSRDNLLPPAFGKINEKFLTPIWSIVASGVVVGASILLLDVAKIAKFASVFMILIYMLENFAVIVLRETRVQWYRPAYKSFAYPTLQIFGIVCSLVLLLAMGKTVPAALMVVGVPGLILYLLFSRKRTDRRGVLGIRGPRQDLLEENAPHQLEELQLPESSKVVVAMFGKERSPEVLTEMGMALSDGNQFEVVHFTEIPEQTDLNDIVVDSVQVRAVRRRINHMALTQQAPLSFDPIVSHDIFKAVNNISQRLDCNWLVVEWGGKTRGAFTMHNPMGWLRDHLSCHLMSFRDKGVRYFKKIMVIVRTDKSNDLLLETADHLARVFHAEITLVTYVQDGADQEVNDWQSKILSTMTDKWPRVVDHLVVSGKREWEAYTLATSEFDLVMFEAERVNSRYMSLFGTPFDKLMEHSACSVVSIKTKRNESRTLGSIFNPKDTQVT